MAAWAGWHAPLFLVLHSYASFGGAQAVGLLFGITCGALVATWLYNHTGGSIFAVAVWHGLYNALSGTVAATSGSGTIAAIVSAGVMIQGVGLLVRELRARRHGQPSVLGASGSSPAPVDRRSSGKGALQADGPPG